MGGCFIKACSKTMDLLALSSGESELGALTKACTEGLGIQSLLSDFQIRVDIKVLSDATAAIGMARRLGLGRVRHLATSDLWVQQRVRSGDVSLAKYPGSENGADLMTKYQGRFDTLRLLQKMGFAKMSGRATVAPKRYTAWDVSEPMQPPRADTELDSIEASSSTASCQDHMFVSKVFHDKPMRSCMLEGRNLSCDN